MGAILAAQLARTPLVATAGQQDMRHIADDPLLTGDLVNLARPAVKWARELTHPDQIPVLLRRAFRDSQAAPTGPGFLSLPVNIMYAATSADSGRRANIELRTITTAIDKLAEKLRTFSPGKLTLIVGDEVFSSRPGRKRFGRLKAG
ncbi:hypothetical protein [Mesorhizobium comanense]|uniref:hypothetical protein n=1 Tax=Mesorhizobium comanense TaxID=2502215 RepID=UPI0038CC1960